MGTGTHNTNFKMRSSEEKCQPSTETRRRCLTCPFDQSSGDELQVDCERFIPRAAGVA